MTKIEEILFKYIKGESYTQQMFSIQDLIVAMKEYSEIYAQKCLIIAADEADVIEYGGRGCHVDKNSILNIKLPEHE